MSASPFQKAPPDVALLQELIEDALRRREQQQIDYLSPVTPRGTLSALPPCTPRSETAIQSLSAEIKSAIARRLAQTLQDFFRPDQQPAVFSPPQVNALYLPAADGTQGYIAVPLQSTTNLPVSPVAKAFRQALATLCSIAGLLLAVASLLGALTVVASPVELVVQLYLALFGFLIFLTEASYLPFHSLIGGALENWCRVLTTSLGKGLFDVFVGVLSLSFWRRSTLNLAAGSVLMTVGAVRFHDYCC